MASMLTSSPAAGIAAPGARRAAAAGRALAPSRPLPARLGAPASRVARRAAQQVRAHCKGSPAALIRGRSARRVEAPSRHWGVMSGPRPPQAAPPGPACARISPTLASISAFMPQCALGTR